MQDSEFWIFVINLVVSLGTVTAVGAFGRYVWNRWRWRRFKRAVPRQIVAFIDRVVDVDHPNQMEAEHWMSFVEEMLNDAGFSPFESTSLTEIGVATAKTLVPQRQY